MPMIWRTSIVAWASVHSKPFSYRFYEQMYEVATTGGDKQKDPGMWTRRTSRSTGNGAICIELLIMTATWWIRGVAEKRDMNAAKQFFTRAVAVVGHAPASVTTDGHRSYPRAIRSHWRNNGSYSVND